MILFASCLIAGIRLARETPVNHRQIPTSNATNDQLISSWYFQPVFREVPEKIDRTKIEKCYAVCHSVLLRHDLETPKLAEGFAQRSVTDFRLT
jgi:hypothetical protein